MYAYVRRMQPYRAQCGTGLLQVRRFWSPTLAKDWLVFCPMTFVTSNWYIVLKYHLCSDFDALTLSVGQQAGHMAVRKLNISMLMSHGQNASGFLVHTTVCLSGCHTWLFVSRWQKLSSYFIFD